MLLLRSTAPLVLARLAGAAGPPPEGDKHEHIRQVLARSGACFFSDIAPPSSLARNEEDGLVDALWDLVWAGEVSNDTFAVVRAAAARGGARRSSAGAARGPVRRPRLGSLVALGPPRAQGRWSLVSRPPEPDTAASVAVAEILLERHGVLTREAVRAEGVPGGFASLYPVLKAMEESGRVRRGYFVAGLGAAQFAVPGAVDRLRSVRESTVPAEPFASAAGGAPLGSVGPAAVLLAATDPANPYGATLPWPVKGPQRAAGAYVVLLDGEACLWLDRGRRSVLSLRPHDGGWEEAAVEALAGLVRSGRTSRLSLARYDEALEPWLHSAGFVPTPRGMVRYA